MSVLLVSAKTAPEVAQTIFMLLHNNFHVIAFQDWNAIHINTIFAFVLIPAGLAIQ